MLKEARNTYIHILKSFKAYWVGQSDTLNLISLDYVTYLFLSLLKILETMTSNVRLLLVILLKVMLDCGYVPTLLFTNM
jgi:hypothetical protein